MNIDRVRYFHVFSESGSLVKAAEILRISQPALSKALKLLEQELGTELVEPEGRGLRLTPQGVRFKAITASLLQQWSEIPQQLLRDEGESQKIIRLGTFEVFSTYFLSRISSIFEGGLELRELGPGNLEQSLVDGIIDLGVTYIPIPKSGIEFLESGEITMNVFGVKRFVNTPFAELPFVIPLSPMTGTPSKVIGLDGWPDDKYQRNIRFRVTLMESALELCRRGIAVAYLPEFVVRIHNETTKSPYALVPLTSQIKESERRQKVYLVRRNARRDTKTERALAKCLRELA